MYGFIFTHTAAVTQPLIPSWSRRCKLTYGGTDKEQLTSCTHTDVMLISYLEVGGSSNADRLISFRATHTGFTGVI